MFAGTHVLIKQLNHMANAELCFACFVCYPQANYAWAVLLEHDVSQAD